MLWLDAATPQAQPIEVAVVRAGAAGFEPGMDLRLALRDAHLFPGP
jgi:hypothetical protein